VQFVCSGCEDLLFRRQSAHGQPLKRLIGTVILLLVTLCSTYRRGIHEAPIWNSHEWCSALPFAWL